MCDGHDCANTGTVKLGEEWYCREHAEAIQSGIDTMFEDEMNNVEMDIDF